MGSPICCTEERTPHSNQLLNHVVDCIASRRPETLYAEFPVSQTSYDEGCLKFTYKRFSNAINIIAWWLHDNIGPGVDFPTVAYIGPNNLIYPSLILGAVKAGYKTLLLSPRNSLDAQMHLMKATECDILLTTRPRPLVVDTLLAAAGNNISSYEIPTVEELLQTNAPAFPYSKTLKDAQWDPLAVLHTSGSTGLPKPVTWVQGFAPSYAKQFGLDPPEGYESVDRLYMGNRAFVVFPPFHAAYLAHALINAICNETVAIIPLSGAIPSAKSLSNTLKNTKVDMAFVVPTIIEEMSRSSDLLRHISTNVELIAYSGGDVPQRCGDIVARCVPIVNFYGTTEGASIALIRRKGEIIREDWKYLTFHPESGAVFRPHTEDLYELVLIRKDELKHQHQIFTTFPDIQEYRTKDLYTKHTSKPNLWRHVGRADDTILFSTGEKVNPISMEQHIFSQNPDVAGAVVVGSQRFQAALLLELTSKEPIDDTTWETVLENIWPSIEDLNMNCPSHARLMKSHIIFTEPHRPLPRSPKGTIQRAAALAEYAAEIDAVYKRAENGHIRGEIVNFRDGGGVLSYLKAVTFKITRHKFGDTENFFVRGMDSLQAMVLAREMKKTLGKMPWDVGDIYNNPSISLLAKALQASPEQPDTYQNDIDTLLDYYTTSVDEIQIRSTPSISRTKIFLLTGSTGRLGSHLLQALLEKPESAHIYCLNRSSDAKQRLVARSKSESLMGNFPAERVTFLTANYSAPDLGLQNDIYATLLKHVTNIIHNAWPVDFNIPLSSFRPQLDGVVNLVKLASASGASILFVSSVDAVSQSKGPITENIIFDSTAPTMGYGQSKYMAERILDHAQKLHLNIQIVRVGQIAGQRSGHGEWSRSEWLPRLVRSSLHVGAVPTSLGPRLDGVDWIPIDVLANALVEIDALGVFNFINAHVVEWRNLVPTIVEVLSSRRPIESVSLEAWIDMIEEQTDGDLELLLAENPALKLLQFYKSLSKQSKVEWITNKGPQESKALRELEGIKGEWMQKWARQWVA